MKSRSLIEQRINNRPEDGSAPVPTGAAAWITSTPPRTSFPVRRRKPEGDQASRRSQ